MRRFMGLIVHGEGIQTFVVVTFSLAQVLTKGMFMGSIGGHSYADVSSTSCKKMAGSRSCRVSSVAFVL